MFMERFLSLPEVEHVTSLKKSKLYDLVRTGQFPRQRKITQRRRGWLSSEVEGWIQQRSQGSSFDAVTGSSGVKRHD
jgi:prophage regulatory protein